MSLNLKNHISRFAAFNPEELENIVSRFKRISLAANENIVIEGAPCSRFYFVNAGSLRLFFLSNSNTEQTIHFALENWWITDLTAFNTGKGADFSIQALEKSDVSFIEKAAFDRLLTDYPTLGLYFYHIHQRAYAASLYKVKSTAKTSKEDFYAYFTTTYPDFVKKLSNEVLASYIGVSCEYLEELKSASLS